MADLGYTDAQWTRFSRELGVWLRIGRTMEENRRRYSRERIQVRKLNDTTPYFTALSFSAMSNYGTSCDEEGRVYIRIVANGSNWDINVYKATGASGLVAQATNVAASGTKALTAQNSSGLTGSVTLGGSISGDATDNLQALLLPDWKRESLLIFPSDGTTSDDTYSRQAFEGFLQTAARLEQQKLAAWRSAMAQWATSAPGNPVARGSDFMKERLSSLITEVPDQDSSGGVSRDLTGFFPVMKQAMADETTGSTQDIAERVVAASSITFGSNNTGSGTMAAPTPDDHAPIGEWVFKCERGLGNGYGGDEEFSLIFTGADDSDDQTLTGGVNLKIGQSYSLPRGGGSVTLVRSFTKTGDATNADAGAASTFTFSGETENNTDSGAVYCTIAANGTNWDFKFYKASARNTGDLVAQATNVATAATSQEASARNGSGLTIVFDVGSGPTDTNTFTIDANYFSVENSANVPDEFRFNTTLTSSGKASRVLAELLGAELNGITSGSEQIDDNLLAGANTDLNYASDDI